MKSTGSLQRSATSNRIQCLSTAPEPLPSRTVAPVLQYLRRRRRPRRQRGHSFKALAVFFVLAVFSAAAASATDSAMVPAPAPAQGSACSMPVSGAIAISSVVLTLLAIMKQY
ncbi:hypothetical protein RHSIM_Rhsim07G0054600 [Rhododendron simsii]|uniref:Uncharacterized protein n=1 Tax=Rhododendron simsii TaxID=118357 RepID=A0A834GPM9_RHOSS|nr:hypothetical protein RHSIM_Rhsim07G0054600 [Rhododendron simsii]